MSLWTWIGRFRKKPPLASASNEPPITSRVAEFRGIAELGQELIQASQLDAAAKSSWISDLKEAYYSALAASDLISRAPERSRAMLLRAASKTSQAASELKTLGAEGRRLAASLESTMQAIRAALEELIPRAAPARPETPPPARIAKIGANNFQLLCSVCGKPVAEYRMIENSVTKKPMLFYAGPAKTEQYDLSEADAILALLESDSIAALHERVKGPLNEEGIEVYCPKCDRIYCDTHYNLTVEWDQGFYDCARGTCPFGHSRKLDD